MRCAWSLFVVAIALATVARTEAAERSAKPIAGSRPPGVASTRPSSAPAPAATAAPRARVIVAPSLPPDPGAGPSTGTRSGWGGYLGELGPHIRRTLAATRLHPITWGAPPATEPPPGGRRSGDPPGEPPAPDGKPAETREQNRDLPVRLELGPVIPNPSSGTVSFALALPSPASVRVSVIDVAGRIVHESIESRAAGHYVLSWSGRDVGGVRVLPGIYFVRVLVDGRPLGTRRWVVLQ